ncbi:protein SCAI homolog isoform X1 [Dendrobium catenatum]|uniref:protein SCAI homolog isoform X1 n=1 Tax=Dendrobium catenatum TaxID=906689 RepID=UPI0009F36B09|nr:protein SCAI homolog isoform X1 [Dendrobium catenatum]
MSDDVDGEAFRTFRSLIESADRKFARVRDLPPYGRGPLYIVYYRKVFKTYTRLWRFQQEHRRELVAAGLRRWEIGEIASRIGQLYYGQYQRTSEARFLLESYIFYEAILSRRYFEPPLATGADLGLRFKELRFHARFLLVAMLLNRKDVVMTLAERFRALVENSKSVFRETSFKEWKQVLQEIFRFLKADTSFTNTRPLRYSLLFDAHPSSLPYIARLHKRRVLKLQDALLTSYRRTEIKITELTLDAYRMIQCLEWEPSGSFYQVATTESSDNGACSDQSGASGLIDINLFADMTDPSLPPNPRKAVIYHPSVSHLMTVVSTICEELSSDSILLIYVSASGKVDQIIPSEKDSSQLKPISQDSYKNGSSFRQAPGHSWLNSSDYPGSLCLGSRGSGGVNNLFPEDLIPFTRKPLFIIIDSENSHSFKKIHGSERGEAAALLLSPRRPSSVSNVDVEAAGSQFTYFLTAPLLAFIQLVGLKSDIDVDVCSSAESILSSAIAEWEVILCTSESLDQVWAQVLPDPFLRRLILRFIFCRAALALLCTLRKDNERLPVCLPSLPEPVSPDSPSIQWHILKLAETLGVVSHFEFSEALNDSAHR